MRDLAQRIVTTFKTSRGDTTFPKRKIVLTAPHAAEVVNPIDDPCTKKIAQRMELKCREILKIPCRSFVSTLRRDAGDQNRLSSFGEVDDVATDFKQYIEAQPQFLSDAIHIDIHSFTATDSENTSHKLPSDWGTGLNILCLKGDKDQYEAAGKMKAIIDSQLKNVYPMFPPTTVVEHDKIPKSVNSPDSNAMIEMGRYYGALSLLIEFPVLYKGVDGSSVYDTTTSLDTLVEAVLTSLLPFVHNTQ